MTEESNEIRILSACAMIAAIRRSGCENPHIECFVPIVLQVFDHNTLKAEHIKKEIKSIIPYALTDISDVFLNKILDVSIEKKYIQFDSITHEYKLTKNGEELIISKREDAREAICSLQKDIENYLKEKHNFRTTWHLLDVIEFLNNSAGFLLNIDNFQSIKKEHIASTRENPEDILFFIDYLNSKTDLMDAHLVTFKNLMLGVFLTSILTCPEAKEINPEDFRGKIIFFDTNIVISLLGYHGTYLQKTAKGLYDVLNEQNCSFKIFDFTLEQLKSVIHRSLKQIKHLAKSEIESAKISVNSFRSIYSVTKHFCEINKTPEEVEEISKNISTIVADFGLEIYSTNLNIRTKILDADFSKFVHDNSSKYANYKSASVPISSDVGSLHDFAAIYTIKKLRQKRAVSFKEANSIFITSDKNLARFNEIEMYNKNSAPEIITDAHSIAMFWAMQADSVIDGIPIDTIVSALWDKYLFTDNVLNDFVATLNELFSKIGRSADSIRRLSYNDLRNLIVTFSINRNIITKELLIKVLNESKNNQEKMDKKVDELDENIKKLNDKVVSLQGDLNNKEKTILDLIRQKNLYRKLWICLVIFIIICVFIWLFFGSAG